MSSFIRRFVSLSFFPSTRPIVLPFLLPSFYRCADVPSQLRVSIGFTCSGSWEGVGWVREGRYKRVFLWGNIVFGKGMDGFMMLVAMVLLMTTTMMTVVVLF
jgi:hypothetical protein